CAVRFSADSPLRPAHQVLPRSGAGIQRLDLDAVLRRGRDRKEWPRSRLPGLWTRIGVASSGGASRREAPSYSRTAGRPRRGLGHGPVALRESQLLHFPSLLPYSWRADGTNRTARV